MGNLGEGSSLWPARHAAMSKSKLRGIVGYTCYTRPSLQCTYLSCLKPGKIANEEGSYLPTAFRGRYERASTAPAGKTRTIHNLMAKEIKEESYLDIDRPNPVNADIEKAMRLHDDRVSGKRPLTNHWKSVNKQSFTDRVRTEGSPAQLAAQ